MDSAGQPVVIPLEYLNKKEALSFTRLPQRAFDRLCRIGHGPPKIKPTRKCVLFPRQGLIDWLNSYQVSGKPIPAPKRKRGRPRKAVAR